MHHSKGESLLAGLKKKDSAKEILRVSRSFPFPPVFAEPRHMFIIWMAMALTWVGDPRMTKKSNHLYVQKQLSPCSWKTLSLRNSCVFSGCCPPHQNIFQSEKAMPEPSALLGVIHPPGRRDSTRKVWEAPHCVARAL